MVEVVEVVEGILVSIVNWQHQPRAFEWKTSASADISSLDSKLLLSSKGSRVKPRFLEMKARIRNKEIIARPR